MIQGDYERRTRGLEALFRPRDLLEYDILRSEMCAGRADGWAGTMATPYIILRAYALAQGTSVGAEWDGEWIPGHVMGYLASAIIIQGHATRYPPLVITAYEELLNESVPKVFLEPSPKRIPGSGPRKKANRPSY